LNDLLDATWSVTRWRLTYFVIIWLICNDHAQDLQPVRWCKEESLDT